MVNRKVRQAEPFLIRLIEHHEELLKLEQLQAEAKTRVTTSEGAGPFSPLAPCES